MKKGGGSASTIIIGPSKSVLVYALHSLEYILGLARFRVFVPKIILIIINNLILVYRKKIVKNLLMSSIKGKVKRELVFWAISIAIKFRYFSVEKQIAIKLSFSDEEHT